MIRWKPPNLTRSHTVTPWQSRTEILKKHLESLSPEDLRQIRPDHYWLRFGQKAWMRGQSRNTTLISRVCLRALLAAGNGQAACLPTPVLEIQWKASPLLVVAGDQSRIA